MSGTLAASWGAYGGFYATRSPGAARLSLGWLALTWLQYEIDDYLEALAILSEKNQGDGD